MVLNLFNDPTTSTFSRNEGFPKKVSDFSSRSIEAWIGFAVAGCMECKAVVMIDERNKTRDNVSPPHASS
jgi:hypothetical protein